MTDKDRLISLLKVVEKEAASLGIPTSKRIKDIVINNRARKRLGCCRQENSLLAGPSFVMEISGRLLEAEEKVIKEVIAHELLHTCPGCMNHGKKWKLYAGRMSEAFGYEITRTYAGDKYGTDPQAGGETYKYTLVCTDCGMKILRRRRSRLVENPQLYRCGKCGGEMKLCEKSTTSCR